MPKTYFRILQKAPNRFWLQKKESWFGKWEHLRCYPTLADARKAGQDLDFKPVVHKLREDLLNYC